MKLPDWLAGGPEVSEFAYRIVVVVFDDPPRPRAIDTDPHGTSVGEVVDYLAEQLDADEGDVLRAMAELERVGAFEVQR